MSKYKIIHNGKEFDASIYQDEIFEFIEHGSGNLVVNALAGSAKTTSLLNAVRFIPSDKKIMIVTFNRHIAEEANEKKSGDNVIARTCSSVGFEMCRENNIGLGAVDDEKYTDYIRANIDTLTQYGETASLGKAHLWTYMSNIRDLVDKCRVTLSFTVKEIERAANKYGIVPLRDEIEVCRQVLIWGKSNTDIIDQTDMVWLPCVLNLTTKRLLKDFIFVDEAQDISIAQYTLIMKCAKRGCRIVAVGDRNQQINQWCGADDDAIGKFDSMPNTKTLPLPICYRCAKKIIEFANDFANDTMIPADWAPDGEIIRDATINNILPGDMVLSRNTAPLIELQQTLLNHNLPAKIQGAKTIREDYLRMIENYKNCNIDIECKTREGLFYNLYKGFIEEINNFITSRGMTEEEAVSRPSILYYYDNLNGLKAIAQGLTTVSELIDKINMIFSNTKDKHILLSTVHRAKGLEADRVFIYKPSILENNRIAKQPWELKAERNLQYVAYTRAKEKLYFIEEEKDFWKKNPYAANNLVKEIEYIKEKIGYTKKWEYFNFTPNIISRDEIKTIEEKIITSSTPKPKKGGMRLLDLR